ncbi:MAG: peptidoglycan DD-metalloendopeptidase family protein [Chromatiales bacterium]|nr:peptidoglycan DD-metalloendopeptidase family protein [Chromatiales bacterium]
MLSRRLGWLLLLALLGVGLSGCGSLHPPGGEQVINYTVKPGDTLYSISWRYGYDYRQVAAWNQITAPYTIRVGQQIRIIPSHQQRAASAPTPIQAPPATSSDTVARAPAPSRPPEASRPVARPSSPTPSSPTPSTRPTPTPSRPAAPATAPAPTASRPSRPAPATAARIVWQWPTRGTQKYAFNVAAGKKGMGIAGRQGQAIVAAAGGEVVYSGSGLIGYGNLLIIKHDDVYLSAYGHNRRLLVQEGARVKRGQPIAEMGESNRDGVVLHFEIRRDGNPVNPTLYLPKAGS